MRAAFTHVCNDYRDALAMLLPGAGDARASDEAMVLLVGWRERWCWCARWMIQS